MKNWENILKHVMKNDSKKKYIFNDYRYELLQLYVEKI